MRDARTRRRPAAGTVTSPKQACGRLSARQRGAQPAEPEPQSSRSAQRGRKPTGASTRRAPRSPPHRRRPAPARGRGQCADEAVRARGVGDAGRQPGTPRSLSPSPKDRDAARRGDREAGTAEAWAGPGVRAPREASPEVGRRVGGGGFHPRCVRFIRGPCGIGVRSVRGVCYLLRRRLSSGQFPCL